METSRIVGMAIAIAAAALVIVAGRSCTKSISEANKRSGGSGSSTTPSYHLITDNEPQYSEPPTGEPQSIEETTEPEREYETVTNMFGDVVETIPITSPEEADQPTTTKSILDSYNELHTTSPEEAQRTTKYVEIPDEITIHVGW